jgi:hypothetical protein
MLSRFDLTKSLCVDITSMICRYWWSSQEKENKVHWLAWGTLCQRKKKKGGLGYKYPHIFNLAMPASTSRMALTKSLCAQVLKAKYFLDGNILDAEEMKGISYSLRSIIRGVQALKTGLI